MPVVSVDKDLDHRRLTITATYDAPVERVWQLYADPRQLERHWGPPTYPATVVDHDLRPGGRVTYYMTGPEGDRHGGYWEVVEVDPPHRFVVRDGFADASGEPNPDLPVTLMTLELEAREDGGTTMTITSTYESVEALQQVLDMGVEEGLRGAMGQIDALLAAA